jgi:hypothetical protein
MPLLPVRRLNLQRLLRGWLLLRMLLRTLVPAMALWLACAGSLQAQGVELAGRRWTVR